MEDTNSSSGAPLDSSGKENKTPDSQTKNDSVSHESHRKLLAEKKAIQERLAGFEAKEREALEKSGEFQKLYDEQKEENRKLAETLKKETATFAYNSVASQFHAQVAALGCKRPEALEKLVDMNELAKAVGAGYKVDAQALKVFAEKAAKEHDYLFAKEAPTFRDAAPGAGKPAQPMSVADEVKTAKTQKELDAILKKHGLI